MTGQMHRGKTGSWVNRQLQRAPVPLRAREEQQKSKCWFSSRHIWTCSVALSSVQSTAVYQACELLFRRQQCRKGRQHESFKSITGCIHSKSTEQHPRCASLYEGSINMGLLEQSPIPQRCRYHSEETLFNQPPQTSWLRLLANVQVFSSAAETGQRLEKKCHLSDD